MFRVFVSVVLDGLRSLDCERSIAGDRPTGTKEDLRVQVSLRLTQLKKKELCKVKCHPEVRYTETDKVNELDTKKQKLANLCYQITSRLSDCCPKTGMLIHKLNILL
jgi:hypothetical protein